eukprot:915141-Rhodomonas_salina.2
MRFTCSCSCGDARRRARGAALFVEKPIATQSQTALPWRKNKFRVDFQIEGKRMAMRHRIGGEGAVTAAWAGAWRGPSSACAWWRPGLLFLSRRGA